MNMTDLSRREEGAALIELAVSLPIVILVLFMTVDFVRVYYVSIALTNAARAGAQYGAQTVFVANTVQTKAAAASPSISPYTVALPTQACFCMNDSGAYTGSIACSATCSTPSDHVVAEVTVTTQKTFTTITAFPGVPSTIALSRTASQRSK
jgi:Flp pilus assembly protein TadG